MSYKNFECSEFQDRYISFSQLEYFINENLSDKYKKFVIGYSEENKPIYALDVGQGHFKLLVWSQMHGNETTTTKALFDFLNFIQFYASSALVQWILNSCQIRIIPMLNPDGASLYTRKNTNGIDLNRDAFHKTQRETQVFFKVLNEFQPDYCFNMHGQRTIFSAGINNYPATISFLSPSYDVDLNLNHTRKTAMKLIVAAQETLKNFIPNQIGRYDDAHNLNCFGDYIQKMGIPTVLFEAGHFANDYSRNKTRQYVFLSFLKMIETIAHNKVDDFHYKKYFQIPLNQKRFYDCIIKNVKNSKSNFVGIQYKEVLNDNRITFEPYIATLEDLSFYYAHKCLDAKQNKVVINGSVDLKKDLIVNTLNIGSTIIEL